MEFVKAVRETEGKIQLWHDVYGGDLIKYGGKKLVSRSWSSNSNVRWRQGPWHHYRRFIDFIWKTSMCFRFHICIALMIVVLDVKTGFIQAPMLILYNVESARDGFISHVRVFLMAFWTTRRQSLFATASKNIHVSSGLFKQLMRYNDAPKMVHIAS